MFFIRYAKATMHCLHVLREMSKTQSFYWVNVMCYIMKGLQCIMRGISMPIFSIENPKEIWWTEPLSLGLGEEARYWWITHSGLWEFLLLIEATSRWIWPSPNQWAAQNVLSKKLQCWWDDIQEERALELSFLKKCSDRSEQEKGLSSFEAKWSFIIYILGNVHREGSMISNYVRKLGKNGQ